MNISYDIFTVYFRSNQANNEYLTYELPVLQFTGERWLFQSFPCDARTNAANDPIKPGIEFFPPDSTENH